MNYHDSVTLLVEKKQKHIEKSNYVFLSDIEVRPAVFQITHFAISCVLVFK